MGSIHSRRIHKDMDFRRLAPVIVLMSDRYLKDKKPFPRIFLVPGFGWNHSMCPAVSLYPNDT